MHIAVLGGEDRKEEFLAKAGNGLQVSFTADRHIEADAWFLLDEKENVEPFTIRPVFINAVSHTLQQYHLPGNFCRFNGWPGFIHRDLWEVAGDKNTAALLDTLNWKYTMVEDTPGLVSARVLSMIINEAYFALGDGISSREEIDLAMKLGTNYPYGPFEWAHKIGPEKIVSLLRALSVSGKRYEAAPALKAEITLHDPSH